MFVGETSAGGDERPGWLAYIASEVRGARSAGAAVEGVCLYPILDHPHWDGGYPLEVGLWSYPDESGHRGVHVPYARRVARELRA